MSYYPEPDCHNRNKIKVELYFSNYAIKSDFSCYATHIITSKFATNVHLGSLQYEVDKLDVDKLKTVPIHVKKFGRLVEKYVL